MTFRPFYVGHRPAVRDALAALADTEPSTDPTGADAVVVDLVSFALDDLVAELAGLRHPATTPRIVLSALGAGTSTSAFATEIARLEARVTAGAPGCVLRCGMLGESLAFHLDWVLSTGDLHGCFDAAGVSWLHAGDLARMVRLLHGSPERWGDAYDVTGPERMPMDRLAARLGAATGTDATYVPHDVADYTDVLTETGLPPAFASRLTEAQVLASTGPAADPSPVVASALGRATPLEDYLHDIVRAHGTDGTRLEGAPR